MPALLKDNTGEKAALAQPLYQQHRPPMLLDSPLSYAQVFLAAQEDIQTEFYLDFAHLIAQCCSLAQSPSRLSHTESKH